MLRSHSDGLLHFNKGPWKRISPKILAPTTSNFISFISVYANIPLGGSCAYSIYLPWQDDSLVSTKSKHVYGLGSFPIQACFLNFPT